MSALARDVRGNTMAIMAAALIPLAGMVGGGIDISRMYITKTRLQHACDAGALAGRKAMGGGVWAQTITPTPNMTAELFFDSNFQQGAYGTSSVSRSFAESAGKVTGTASASIPMTLMKIFGKMTETLSVTCDAEMRLPNTDVMFVLDNTGSMACDSNGQNCSGGATSKIVGLKVAVKCFYEIVARLNTDADCATGNPGNSGTGTQTQIRFGFVPYSTNVNVGKLLPTAYFADQWPYQTREAQYISQTTYTFPNPGAPNVTNTNNTNTQSTPISSTTTTENSSSDCSAQASPDTTPASTGSESAPSNVITTSSGSTQTVTYTTTEPYTYDHYTTSYNRKKDICTVTLNRVTYNLVRSYTRSDAGVPQTTQVFNGWNYAQLSKDVSGLKNGTSWKNSFTMPRMTTGGGDRTITWNGCIEERQTITGTNFSPIPAAAKDLNIDMIPVQGDVSTQWGPALNSIIYMRLASDGAYTRDAVPVTLANHPHTNNNLDFSQPNAYCPAEARKLQAWPTASTFDSYVDALTPTGNTYHDIGMLWGARLMSPTGLFASENAYTSQGGEIERHMIFMTDGDTQTSTADFAAYGLPWYDRYNVASPSGNPGDGNMNAEVNARFLAICSAVKNMNITLWVISFGNGSNTATEDRLSQCSTSGRFFTARDSAALQTTFASIANQISQLRLTK